MRSSFLHNPALYFMATTFATSSLASFLVDAVVPSHVASLPSMLLGINALSGTYCPCGSAAVPCAGGPLNATAALQRLRPAIVRTHDAKLLDPHIYKSGHAPWGIPTFNWNDVYPDLKADPMHPQSFDWTIVDAWMSQWDALGIPVLLRLGDSWAPKAAVSNVSLVDAEHLSTAFVQVVRHLNDGWGGGRAPPAARLRIRYVEVWNEPEGAFWTGSLPAFYRLLTLTIQKLRAYDDDLRVGPNNASPYGENGGTLRKGFELTALDAVLNATADARLRPTLYSWHAYIHQNPTLFGTLINETRARLDARGLVDAEQVDPHQKTTSRPRPRPPPPRIHSCPTTPLYAAGHHRVESVRRGRVQGSRRARRLGRCRSRSVRPRARDAWRDRICAIPAVRNQPGLGVALYSGGRGDGHTDMAAASVWLPDDERRVARYSACMACALASRRAAAADEYGCREGRRGG